VAARNLNLSGLNDYFSPREYVGSHLAMFLLGVCLPLFLLLYPDAKPGQVLALALILGIILFFMPFIVLNDIIKKRRHAIFKALPYFLDLVTLLVESGLDFSIAMDRAAQQLGKGPLQDEVNRFTHQIQLGQPRKKALNELADRSDIPQMRTLATALIQQEQLGSRIETVLRRQSEILRFQRMQMAETKANKAPVQILIPMVIFIFPSIFLILIGPMVIKSAAGGG
jgi:tight adherence protein C